MQKKLIALAVAGLISAPVFAQSNVTVYGIADVYYGFGKYDDNKFNGIESGGLAGSRLGFKGSEDLGNGLKALFTLEYSIDLDKNEGVGTTGLRSRQQFVGLQGGFGFIGAGRQYAPGYGYVAKYDTSAIVPLSPYHKFVGANGSNIQAGSASRVSNSINYISPNFGGLTINAIYGFNEVNQDEDRTAGDLAQIGADYTNGPLAVSLIYSQVSQDAGAIPSEKFNGIADDDKKEWFVGASYDFKVVKVTGMYNSVEDADNNGDTNNVWALGAIVPVSAAGSVRLSYAAADNDRDDSDADGWTVYYYHGLSKRTTLYTGYARISNDDATSHSLLASTAGQGADENASSFVVGVNHTF
ncbi:porin [Thauera aromatica]|uniref:Outer membrane protein assembly factor n=1 Tax=Thauera aromatica K172 TaxID=44139 RepID=A0A2R4BK55_THAAR|nr:porin [Thauera aromatica]AVR87705.1 outer membrane protein assembly factor [Thauera aromatica K172]